MAGSGKIKFAETLLAKILPLVIVVPLFFSLQTFFPNLQITFDFKQGAYVLALGIITVVSFIEFRIAQGGIRGIDSLNLGSGIAILLTFIGIGLLLFAIGFNYDFNDATINQWVSAYMGFAILVIGIQAIREVTGTRKSLKTAGLL